MYVRAYVPPYNKVYDLEFCSGFLHLEFLKFSFGWPRFGLQNLPYIIVDFLFF